MQMLTDILLWFSAISAGLMAGVYFTFSAFGMKSLAALEKPAGMLAMQSINRVILQSPFLPLFFASSLSCLALVIIAPIDWPSAASWPMAVGGAIYVAGMTAVTAAFNVPLNNALEAADPSTPESSAIWDNYLKVWTRWNHVRTIACTIACVLLVLAIAVRT